VDKSPSITFLHQHHFLLTKFVGLDSLEVVLFWKCPYLFEKEEEKIQKAIH